MTTVLAKVRRLLSVDAAVTALAKRFGLTEGQAYSILISATVAIVLAGAGLPPVLRHMG